jgi:RNA polymerase sigma factor (sigma-70 family)
MSAAPSEQQNRETFFSSAGQQLTRLYEFVGHRLAYLESIGDLMPGELRLEDVIDSVVLRAYHEFVRQPGKRNTCDWLIELANEHLRREVKRLKSERHRAVHIEEDIPETPPVEEVRTLGEEILDFYQPDDDLKLEDIFPDVDVSTPEDFVAAKEELLRCVNASLAGMPREWRRALRLRHTRELSATELAEAFEKSEPEIERILEYGREHLRQSLVESGCTFITKDKKTDRARSIERSWRNG